MQSIKRTVLLLLLATLVLSVSNCKSAKETAEEFEVVKEVPFVFARAAYQDWVAGTREGGSGTKVFIDVESLPEDVRVRDIFFGKRVASARFVPPVVSQMTGHFRNDTPSQVIMDIDPKNEAQNTPPKKFPLPLADKQVGISYTEAGKLKYYIILEVTELEMIAYPASNREDEN